MTKLLSMTPRNAQAKATATRIALLQALDLIHKRLEEIAAEAERTFGHPVCTSSCGACCSHNVPIVMQLEVEHIASSHFVYFSPDQWKHIQDLAYGWTTTKHEGFMYSKGMSAFRLSREVMEQMAHENKLLESSPCPFLLEDKTCAIYPVRPIVCRTYGVLQTPGQECKRGIGPLETEDKRASLAGQPQNYEVALAMAQLASVTANSNPPLPEGFIGLLPFFLAQRTRQEDMQKAMSNGEIPTAARGIGVGVLPWTWCQTGLPKPEHPLLVGVRQSVKQAGRREN